MAEIRTKEALKAPVKTLDRAADLASRMKTATVRTKQQAETSVEAEECNPADYASSKMESGASKIAHEAAHRAEQVGERSVEQTRAHISEVRQKISEHRQSRQSNVSGSQGMEQFKRKKATEAVSRKNTGTQSKISVKGSNTAAKGIRYKPSSSSVKSVKTFRKKPVSKVENTIRTADNAVRTSRQAKKAAKENAKKSAKAAKRSAKLARETAKKAAKGAKATAILIAKTIKAIIQGIKSLIAAIIAGGWAAVAVILIICMIGLILCSAFGVFYSGEDSGTGMTMRTAIAYVNDKYNSNIEVQKAKWPYDELDMSGSRASWKEVIAVYAVKQNYAPDDPQEVASMNEAKQNELEVVFWNMNTVTSNITTRTETETVEEVNAAGRRVTSEREVTIRTLHIVVTHKTADEMAQEYHFTDEQKEMLRELLSEEYDSLWSSLLYGIVSGNSDIVAVAQAQLGNVGGQPYWSWYGFGSRVEWCCCFVSWCANECGYIEQGIIPKYSVVDDGRIWFQNRNQWLDGSEEPQPGMIIFFDWADDGLGDGGDHTGIVEKVENGQVYTIEGNSGDACRENSYPIGYYEILGYGFYDANGTAISSDAASQVWMYLKNYGYSDSVAAGIIGNMMRECGGDTLDLDWNIVGHYNGDEYYGLCQWCLRYTPSDFKGASIRKQIDYLNQTIQSAFANYGGNYNGITYSEFLKADTRTAAIAFERVYERCGNYSSEDNRRANNAERAYNHFH